MVVEYSRTFNKQYKKLPKRIQELFKAHLVLFMESPSNSKLHVHKLHGEYAGLWSFNVTHDVRVVLDTSVEDALLLVAIGTHSELYS